MTATIKKTIKLSDQSLFRDSKVNIIAVSFGADRTYNYHCLFEGEEYIVELSNLENIH